MTLPITASQGQTLLALRTHAPTVRFVVIGATALGHHVTLDRTTADVDLALAVGAHELGDLLEGLGWKRDQRMPQRWYGVAGSRVDALPASAELVRAGSVRLADEDFEMSLIGFDLALDHAENVLVPGFQQTVQVASLASLVVLKMVAWLDRSHERKKDLGDLATIFEQALSAEDERRWNSEHPLGSSQLQHDQQSPFFVGRNVAEIARPLHREWIAKFLRKVNDLRHGWHAIMAQEAKLTGEDPESRAANLLAAFERGFESL